jgi:hypothetical protein
MSVLMKLSGVGMDARWMMKSWMEWNDDVKKKKWSRTDEELFK